MLLDQKALAIEAKNFYGEWKYSTAESSNESRDMIYEKISQLGRFNFIDSVSLQRDLDDGLYFDSNIPIGMGLGSSGALCAGLYDKYSREEPKNYQETYEFLKKLENVYHGTSSGVDPLVSYYSNPILLDESPTKYQGVLNLENIYLYNSEIPRNSSLLISEFYFSLESSEYKDIFEKGYLNILQDLFDSVDLHSDLKFWKKISKMQFRLFKKMIPDSVQKHWQLGLDTEKYFMKLCGAGGGGYFLVYADVADDIDNIKLLDLN